MKFPKPKVVLPLVALLLGVVVTAALVSGRKAPQRQSRPTLPPVVRVQVVELRDTRLDVQSQGNVAPRSQTALVAQVAGLVLEVSPSFVAGGFFAKGDVLLRIDPADYRLGLANAEAEVARAETRLAREEREAEIATRDWAELGRGEPDSLVLRVPQLAEARASLAAARAAREKARVDLERTRVRAPYAGRVREKLADVGRYVTPGTPLGQVYATDAVEIRLALPTDQVAFLDLPLASASVEDGPRVVLRSRFGGVWSEWIGRIVRSEGEIDPSTRMLNVVARVEDPYGLTKAGRTPAGQAPGSPRTGSAPEGGLPGDAPVVREAVPLTVGLFTEASIEGRVVHDVVVLPRSALRGGSTVLVVDPDDRLRRREVDLLRVDREIAVIRGGLREGERVCLSPLDVAVDGMPVRIQESDAERAMVAGRAAPGRAGTERTSRSGTGETE